MNNSLAEVHPELITEWSEKNLPLTPDGITFGSNKKVWWKGTCGHEWQASVKARSNGEKCPICSGARAVAGINDLSTLKPGLASEWSKKNEIKPTEVTVGSHKKVIWKCRLGHEWTASVKSRSINGSGCPYCSHNKVLVGFNDLVRYVPKEKCLQDTMIWIQRIKIYSVTGIMNRTEYSQQKYHELLRQYICLVREAHFSAG